MQVQGGLSSDQISLGSMPTWQITIQWPVKEPTLSLNFNLVPALNPNGVTWVLFATSAGDDRAVAPAEKRQADDPTAAVNVSRLLWANAPGDKLYFEGTWDPTSRTFNWKPKAAQLLGVKVATEKLGSVFQMIILENGGLQIKNFQHNNTHLVSGQSMVRLGEYVKPNTDLTILPNGYRLFFASSSEVLLVDKDNGGVAGARVDKIGCSGNLVFGLITQRDRVEKPEDTPGYFCLDSTTGEITKGMELGAWQDTLKAKGVEEPLLLAPERVGPRM